MRRSTLIAALALTAGTIYAKDQSPLSKGMSNPNAPIEWSADKFVGDANAKTGTYYGNVLIRQGDVRMHADSVRFHVVDNKPDKIFAQGHVVVDAPSGIATGDNGVYEVNPRVIVLNGDVVLTKNNNVMRGSQLTVNLISGVATFNGGTTTGGRVQGLITPQTLSKSSTENP